MTNPLAGDGEGIEKTADEPAKPKFRYSLGLVATIAAHFADRYDNDRAAVERAIKLLDEARETIRRKTTMQRAREEAVKVANEILQPVQTLQLGKRLDFANGIVLITGKRNESDAAKPFNEYVLWTLRLREWTQEQGNALLDKPKDDAALKLRNERVRALLEPPTDEVAKEAEDSKVFEIVAKYRQNGFRQEMLINIKMQFELLSDLVRSYENSKKATLPSKPGKKPRGRPRAAKKAPK